MEHKCTHEKDIHNLQIDMRVLHEILKSIDGKITTLTEYVNGSPHSVKQLQEDFKELKKDIKNNMETVTNQISGDHDQLIKNEVTINDLKDEIATLRSRLWQLFTVCCGGIGWLVVQVIGK